MENYTPDRSVADFGQYRTADYRHFSRLYPGGICEAGSVLQKLGEELSFLIQLSVPEGFVLFAVSFADDFRFPASGRSGNGYCL